MGRTEKSVLFALRKDTGVPLSKQYIHYTLDELKDELSELGIEYEHIPIEDPSSDSGEDIPLENSIRHVPRSNNADPDELAGQRPLMNEEEVLRIDSQGRQWLQEEVRKPAYPKPRGRRVIKYFDTGVATETVKAGDYVETFEVAGKLPSRPAEIKITLPSYQVGIYKDPRFPFKVHCYNGREAFDRLDVEAYYGGPELLPASVKRVYIENDLCYDIRSVVLAIQEEHRHLILSGRLK
jgi:hypothetical protein